MSNKQIFPGGKRSSGDGKAPEKSSNFAQACNLLSQYVKEKGNLKDLRIGAVAGLDDPLFRSGLVSSVKSRSDAPVSGNSGAGNTVSGLPETSPATKPAPEVDLLGKIEKSGQGSLQVDPSVPQFTSFDSFCENIGQGSTSETAQMTIFYQGQVLVFNAFPAEKAKEIMSAANSKGNPAANSTQQGAGLASSSNGKLDLNNSCTVIDLDDGNENGNGVTSTSSAGRRSEERFQAPIQGASSDLPIARRASLHKFLEKRKDRATARAAPYQLHNPAAAGASTAAAGPSSSSKKEHTFDLNL